MIEQEDTYDFSATTFSPDGRLYQVEYAREAVKSGTPALCLQFDKGILFMTIKKKYGYLVDESRKIRKLMKISNRIGVATTGLVADGRVLLDFGMSLTANHRISYDQDISVSEIAAEIGNIMQLYTQFSGMRTFGVVLIVAGIESRKSKEQALIYEIDPSGAVLPHYAVAIGMEKGAMMDVLGKDYSRDGSLKENLVLGAKALSQADENIPEGPEMSEMIDIATVTYDGGYRELSKTDLERFKWK